MTTPGEWKVHMSDLQVRGPLLGSTGSPSPFTANLTGAQRITDAHGRFMDAALAGRLFSIGSGNTALSANTISLTATTTPIVGVWNPPTSPVNLVILQIAAQIYINTLTTPVGSGALVLASSIGNNVISTGSAPFNRKTMAAIGSFAKG